MIPAGIVSCGGEGWRRLHRGSFIVEVAGECEVDSSDPRGIVELASLLRPSETSICQQFVRRVRLGVSEVVGVSEEVGEEDYVFSFAELSLPCGSGAVDGLMHVLSARRAEPLEVSWAGEERVWEEVKGKRWCGLSVCDDEDDGQVNNDIDNDMNNGPNDDDQNQEKRNGNRQNDDNIEDNHSTKDQDDINLNVEDLHHNEDHHVPEDQRKPSLTDSKRTHSESNCPDSSRNNSFLDDPSNKRVNSLHDHVDVSENLPRNCHANNTSTSHINDTTNTNTTNTPNNPSFTHTLLSNPQLLAQLQRLTAGIDTSLDSMKLRDDSVEPDIETFRCNSRGNLPCRVCSLRRLGGVSAENGGGNSGRRKTPRSFQCD